MKGKVPLDRRFLCALQIRSLTLFQSSSLINTHRPVEDYDESYSVTDVRFSQESSLLSLP
jgi:hypothetical protein